MKSNTPTPTIPEPTLAPLATPALPAIYQKMGGVVQGQGVPEAAAFDPNSSSPHRLVMLDTSGEPHPWNDHICFPYEWQPSSVSEVELVVVVSPQREIELGTQRYIGGPPITRYRFERDIIIRQAQTGEVLWKTTIQGSEPPPFPDVAPKEKERLVGSEPTVVDVFQYLREKICTTPAQCPSLYPVIENEEPWYFFRSSPDGSIAGGRPENDPRLIQLWHPSEGKRMGELAHTGKVDWMWFSRNGQLLATLTYEDEINIWRVSDRERLFTVDDVASMAFFSPDSRLLVVEKKGGQVQIWQVADQTLLQTLQPGYSMIDMAISPDGNYLASLAYQEVGVWQIADGKRTLKWEFNQGVFRSLAFSPDSRILASLATGEVRLWQTENGKLIDTISLKEILGNYWVETIAFSPDGKHIAVTDKDKRLQIWRVADKSLLYTLEGVESFTFSPQGDYLAVDERTRLSIRRVQDGEPMRTIGLENVNIHRMDKFIFIYTSDDFKKIMVCPGNLWEKAANR